MKEIFPGRPEQDGVTAKNQTTLIIDEVPSDLAYGIFMESLNNGVALTQQELSREVSKRMDGDKLTVHFNELDGIFTNLLNQHLENQFYLSHNRPSIRISEEEQRLNKLLAEAHEELYPETSEVREEEFAESETKDDYIASAIEAAKEEIRNKYRRNENEVDAEMTPETTDYEDELPLRRL